MSDAAEYEGMTFYELCCLVVQKDAEIAALREAVKDFLCECALVDKFRRYETWQITPWSMDELMKMVEEEP